MKEVHSDTQRSSQDVAEVVSVMEGIQKASGDAINMIKVIAVQINLLALTEPRKHLSMLQPGKN